MFDNLLKGIGSNLNLEGIAKLLIQQVPQGDGILNQALQLAKSGQNPAQIMEALENIMPGAKQKLQGNQIWENLKGKNPQEIETYANNMANTLGIMKNKK